MLQELKHRGLENVIPTRNTEMHPHNLVNLLYMETVPKHCYDDIWKPTYILVANHMCLKVQDAMKWVLFKIYIYIDAKTQQIIKPQLQNMQ